MPFSKLKADLRKAREPTIPRPPADRLLCSDPHCPRTRGHKNARSLTASTASPDPRARVMDRGAGESEARAFTRVFTANDDTGLSAHPIYPRRRPLRGLFATIQSWRRARIAGQRRRPATFSQRDRAWRRMFLRQQCVALARSFQFGARHPHGEVWTAPPRFSLGMS